MRTREKARIWRRFMAGESVWRLMTSVKAVGQYEIEAIIREGARGKFDAVPMNQARVYAKATGVNVGRLVGV